MQRNQYYKKVVDLIQKDRCLRICEIVIKETFKKYGIWKCPNKIKMGAWGRKCMSGAAARTSKEKKKKKINSKTYNGRGHVQVIHNHRERSIKGNGRYHRVLRNR